MSDSKTAQKTKTYYGIITPEMSPQSYHLEVYEQEEGVTPFKMFESRHAKLADVHKDLQNLEKLLVTEISTIEWR